MDRELLVKLLRNDLTEEEARLVKEWLDLSEQNRQYYAAFQLMWEKKKKLPVDVERNYTELFQAEECKKEYICMALESRCNCFVIRDFSVYK